mgnify:FL=1
MLVELNPQIFKKEVFCISSKGFNQRDAYRVMLRKYPDVMNICLLYTSDAADE